MAEHVVHEEARTDDAVDTDPAQTDPKADVPGRDAGEAEGGAHAPRAHELESQIWELTNERDSLHRALAQSERRRQIEGLLRDAESVDVGAALLLTEAAIGEIDGDIDLKDVVAEMVRTKPYLFARDAGVSRDRYRASVMAGAVDSESELVEAATAARETGDRRALLRYLRMRNGL